MEGKGVKICLEEKLIREYGKEREREGKKLERKGVKRKGIKEKG